MLKKYLHTRFRVADMDRSVHFYSDILGMEVVERKTSPRGSQLVFLRFPATDGELELCSFPDSGMVDVPEDLVHLAFQVQDLKVCVGKLESAGIPHYRRSGRDGEWNAIYLYGGPRQIRNRTDAVSGVMRLFLSSSPLAKGRVGQLIFYKF